MQFVLHTPGQEHVKTTSELSKSLESTRAHLQGQLRNKEADNNRLSVQIKVDCFIVQYRFLFLSNHIWTNVLVKWVKSWMHLNNPK